MLLTRSSHLSEVVEEKEVCREGKQYSQISSLLLRLPTPVQMFGVGVVGSSQVQVLQRFSCCCCGSRRLSLESITACFCLLLLTTLRHQQNDQWLLHGSSAVAAAGENCAVKKVAGRAQSEGRQQLKERRRSGWNWMRSIGCCWNWRRQIAREGKAILG